MVSNESEVIEFVLDSIRQLVSMDKIDSGEKLSEMWLEQQELEKLSHNLEETFGITIPSDSITLENTPKEIVLIVQTLQLEILT